MTLARFEHTTSTFFLWSRRLLCGVLFAATAMAAAGDGDTAVDAGRSIDVDRAVAAIEKALEEKRLETKVPGFSMAIVKDGAVVLDRGFGLRDVERKLPVTPTTLFAIGSCTKAFTAAAVMIGVEEGKLSLDDHPREHLPYFKLKDAEADGKITIKDLLTHGSGLASTDLAWYTGVLDREGVIRAVAHAEPTAPLGTTFQYQNVMYSAAGEAVARAYGTSWERVIKKRILEPLGMKATNLSVAETHRSKDRAIGYDNSGGTPRALPMRDLTNIAPAGAINSSSREMTRWLRLMLGRGATGKTRLFGEESYAEMTSPGVAENYGLGWGLVQWRGRKALAHSGGIDGFNSLVALIPEERVGFVMLTNVTSAPMLADAREIVFRNLVLGGEDEPSGDAAGATGGGEADAAASAVPPEEEVGLYDFVEANMKIEVVMKDGQLTAIVPGQPNYALEQVSGRRYKLGAPAPAGFFMTFRAVDGDPDRQEVYLEQPQGNFALPKITASDEEARRRVIAEYDGPLADLLGTYEGGPLSIELTLREGRVAMILPNQPAYPLTEKEQDVLGAENLPETYRIHVERDAEGAVSGLLLKQPQGEFAVRRVSGDDSGVPSITVDELMAKVIEAAGGKEALGALRSMEITADVRLLSQGLTSRVVERAQAPAHKESTITFFAQDTQIGKMREWFDGESGGVESDFSTAAPYTAQQLDFARVEAQFNPVLNWKTIFPDVALKPMTRVGDEDVFVIVKTPEKGPAVTEYISTRTYLVLKRETAGPAGTSTERFEDYRSVEGVMVPHRFEAEVPGLGKVAARVTAVRVNPELPAATFAPAKTEPAG